MDYQPLNFSVYDGQGNNIQHLLTPLEQKIWQTALPFQDKRQDQGHAEVVTYFSLELLKHHTEAKRAIVVPAAILHDTGWSQMSEVELKLFHDPNMKRYEPVLRARHQEEGSRVAGHILGGMNWSPDNITHIVEIISQHDTRNGFYSVEDGLVRDADKLWRFIYYHFTEIMQGNFHHTPENAQRELENYFTKDNFFYSAEAREIARLELENTLALHQKRL